MDAPVEDQIWTEEGFSGAFPVDKTKPNCPLV